MVLDYEALREANIARNKALIASLGLDEYRIPDAAPKAPKKPKRVQNKRKAPPAHPADQNEADDDSARVSLSSSPKKPRIDGDNSEPQTLRRSSRNVPRISYAQGGPQLKESSPSPLSSDSPKVGEKSRRKPTADILDDTKKRNVPKMGQRTNDPKTYGAVPGVPVGTWFATRADCSLAAIHAPYVAGIHGDQKLGAYSIALSGGYDDDVDMGEGFTFTGAGGRDLKGTKANPKNLRTGPQTMDQSFDNPSNKSLQSSVATKNPVRVIRGYKLQSPYAPEEGYRYDGLYVVQKAWMERGINPEGYKVCKYILKRLPGQPPLPFQSEEESDKESEEAR